MKNKLNEAFDNVDEKYIAQTQNPPKKRQALKIVLIAAALALIIAAVPVITVMSRRSVPDITPTEASKGGTGWGINIPGWNNGADEAAQETIKEDIPETVPSPITDADDDHETENVSQGDGLQERIIFASDYSGAKYASVANLSKAPVNTYYTSDSKSVDKYNSLGAELAPVYDKIYKLLLDREQNSVVSPLNVYTALSLLAECTGGESRAEILSALGAGSIEQLRDTAKTLWKFNNKNKSHWIFTQANSVWLGNSLQVNDNCAETLKKEHYASVFSGDFSDQNYVNCFKQWLSDQTNGLLDESIKNIRTVSEKTGAILASTVYYKACWSDTFDDAETGKFNGKECVFNRKTTIADIYKGNGFTAYAEKLGDGSYMWFFLPDDGVTTEQVLISGIVSYVNGEKESGRYSVTFRMPDFDVSYDSNINGVLSKLGINKCSTTEADFSPLTDNDGVYLGEVRHAARIKADKNGVEGAAYTSVTLPLTPENLPPEYDFTLDRPFVFMVSFQGTPTFIGVVNEL
ncbi:MAG: hypothetical protein IKH51_07545 [Clostridia bacterium]|nr:hypothetical protein [Clostridia bacterium]